MRNFCYFTGFWIDPGESFNAKTKAFRSQLRGVRNVEFFLFRLTNIYA